MSTIRAGGSYRKSLARRLTGVVAEVEVGLNGSHGRTLAPIQAVLLLIKPKPWKFGSGMAIHP